ERGDDLLAFLAGAAGRQRIVDARLRRSWRIAAAGRFGDAHRPGGGSPPEGAERLVEGRMILVTIDEDGVQRPVEIVTTRQTDGENSLERVGYQGRADAHPGPAQK